MTIAQYISAALTAFSEGDDSVAMSNASIAVDATGKKMFPAANSGERSKKFLDLHTGLITGLALGPEIHSLKLRCEDSNIRVKYKTDDGACDFSVILYHAVRCSLLHEAEMPSSVRFQDDQIIDIGEEVLTLPRSLIWGVCMAVVLDPHNADEYCKLTNAIRLAGLGVELPIDCFWGALDKYQWLRKTLNEAYARSSESS